MSLQHISDEQLMTHLATGDLRAYKILIQRHENRVFQLAYRMTSHWQDAEDITQEAFIKIHAAAPTYKPKAKFTTWIYRITVNLCIDTIRKRKKTQLPELPENTAATNGNEDQMAKKEMAIAVQNAIAQLNERQRTVIILHRYDRLSHNEISQITGWSVSAIESLLVRAYQKLRELLKHWTE